MLTLVSEDLHAVDEGLVHEFSVLDPEAREVGGDGEGDAGELSHVRAVSKRVVSRVKSIRREEKSNGTC